MPLHLTFGGTRGSVPCPRPDTAIYGGNTSCFRLTSGDDALLIDAGTGIQNFRADPDRDNPILLTHFHHDHVQGLPGWPSIYDDNAAVRLLVPEILHADPRELLRTVWSPPYWPVDVFETSNLALESLPGDRVRIGPFDIAWHEVSHPGGALAYSVRDDDGGGIAVMPDMEWARMPIWEQSELVNWLQDEGPPALLVVDGHFLDEEYEGHEGWGHNAIGHARDLLAVSGAGIALITHHAPHRSDEELDALVEQLKDTRCRIAVEGSTHRLR